MNDSAGVANAPTDLASRDYWGDMYARRDESAPPPPWHPDNYLSLALEEEFKRLLPPLKNRTILEIGCGDSTWLPYLAKTYRVDVAGIDYSEVGCQLARRRLAQNGVSGTIHCVDMFDESARGVGQYGLVYSIGVVEHFDDTAAAVRAMLKFVEPGGLLFVEIPNLRSLHGLMTWLWQPAVFYKHYPLGRRELRTALTAAGCADVHAWFSGLFSLNIVAWGMEPRWPRLEKLALSRIRRVTGFVDNVLLGWGRYSPSMAWTAPYVCAIGRRPLHD